MTRAVRQHARAPGDADRDDGGDLDQADAGGYVADGAPSRRAVGETPGSWAAAPGDASAGPRLARPARRGPRSVPDEDVAPPPTDAAAADGVLSRLDGLEYRLLAMAAFCEGALEEVRGSQQEVARRLNGVEGPGLDTIRAIQGAVGDVAVQIQRAEARTEVQALQARESIRALQRRIDQLEARPRVEDCGGAELARLAQCVARIEAAPAPGLEASAVGSTLLRLADRVEEGQQFILASFYTLEEALAGVEHLVTRLADVPLPLPGSEAPPHPEHDTAEEGAELQDPHERPEDPSEDTRAPLEALAAAETPAHPVEAAVRDLCDQVASTEHRSAKAITQMGHEVIRIAQTLDGRVHEVARRSDERAAQLGSDLSSLAHTLNDRLSRSDDVRAGAMQELGGQIATVAVQLADRITDSESRSAQIVGRGLDDVGERLQRAVETLNRHFEAAASELADRVGEGEERAARVLADAAPQREPAAPPAAPETVMPLAPQGASAASRVRPDLRVASGPGRPSDSRAHAPGPPTASDAVATPTAGVAPSVPRVAPSPPVPAAAAAAAAAPAPAPAPVRPNSHRELIEQARAAARLSAEAKRVTVWDGRPAAAEAGLSANPAIRAGEALVLRGPLASLLKRIRREDVEA